MAPSQAAASAPAQPKDFVYGFAGKFDGCDGSQVATIALTLSCPTLSQDTLVTFDYTANTVKASLATEWQVNSASVTFTLRQGVTFQDGTPFNADAVVFSFRRVWDTTFSGKVTSPTAASVPFKSVEKIDDSHVRVDFAAPAPNLIWGLSSFPAFIQSPTAVKSEGANYNFKPVGTGPYQVMSGTDSRIELQRNPHYWGTSSPQPDHIVLLAAQTSGELVNDLLAGTIDAMQNPPIEQMSQIQSAGFTVQPYPSLVLFYENINVNLAPFNDVHVRQAANYALDKDAINKIAQGTGKPLYGAWFESAYAYWKPDAPYTYDASKAAQLLDLAGWALPAGQKVRVKNGNPLEVKAATYSGTSGVEAAITTVMISDLQAVGFKVDFQTIDSATYDAKTLKPFNIIHFGFGSSFPDPQGWLTRMTTGSEPPAELNLSYYSNPAYDSLVAKAAKDLDPSARVQELMQAQKILYEDAPLLFASQLTSLMLFNPAKFSSVPVLPSSRVDVFGIRYK